MRYADFAPVILAAGASSRMGQPKELLDFQGVTVLEMALRACRDAGCGTPIIVTRGEREARIRALLAGLGHPFQVVVNPTPEEGQTSSLRIGLSRLPAASRAFVVYPVDFPLIRASDVERLCRTFAVAEEYSSTEPDNRRLSLPLSDGAVDLVVPSFARRRGHPVVVSARLAPALLALSPGESARTILSDPAARTLYVEFEDDRVLCDMDTPEAYAACLSRHRA